jgi:aspartyl-tRNA(Asn)/glutamyl-tRNA(Gln) amidotransferase subunit C
MINKEVLEKAAKLSSLILTEEEKEQTITNMSKILEYFDELQKINTDGVKPLHTAVEMENMWRNDQVGVEQSREDLVSVLAETTEGQLKVPQVVK